MINNLLKELIKVSKRVFHIMIIQTISASLLLASGATAQSESIYEINLDLTAQRQSIVDILSEIEHKTDFNFTYTATTLKGDKVVTLNIKDKSLGKVLEEISKQADLKFKRINDNIHIYPKDKNDQAVEEDVESILQQDITGKVSDENGEGLPGVNVVLKGTSTGTVTDVDGKYRLSVPSDATLIFSSVGYVAQEVPVAAQSVIDLILSPDVTALDEIVVIGYGQVEKRDVTGAIGSVNSDRIVQQNPIQPARALQGQVAGVNVRKNNSVPGADYTIDIRGVHSINYSSEPLVVIDGVMGGQLNTINPTDIQSIDVLKDASATAIYGARGANGVIIVTTKKGQTGKTKVTYDAYVGVKNPQMPDMMDAQQFYHAYNDVVIAENPNVTSVIWTAQQQANVDAGRSVNWVDEVTDPGMQTSHVVALSGGNENTTHYFSAGYLNEDGIVLNTGYERFNLKGSIDSKLNNVVKTGFTTYYTVSKRNTGSFETLRSAFRARPTGSIYYSDLINPTETNDRDVDGYAMWMGIKDTQVPNPLMEVQPERYQFETRTNNFLGNAYVELTPLKGLSLKTSVSTTVINDRTGEFRGTDSKSRLNKTPIASNSINMNTKYTLDNIINYKLESGSHQLNVTAAQSAFAERYESSGISVQDLTYNSGWYAFQTAATISGVESRLIERSILSYMGRINYSFKDKYMLTVTGRYDGSSVLAEGNKWAFFPSVAVAWRAGDEQFIKDLNIFSDLKIRLSYGQVGNDVVSPYSTQALLAKTAYDFDGSTAYGYSPNTIGNADLRWEKSSEINLGFNMGFFNNRLTTAIELYNRTTDDLIQDVNLPTSSGFGSVTANVGKIQNKGIEISVNTVNIRRNDITWSSTINFSTNHNEILELYGGSVTRDIGNSLFVGESLQSHYYLEFDGIWQTNEADNATTYGQIPGSVKVVDQNNDGVISQSADETLDDRVVLGNQLPKWLAGINNTVSYKNFDFSVFVYTRQGVMYRNSMLSGTMGDLGSNRYNGLDLNYWTEDNPTNDYYGVWQANPYRQAIQYKETNFWRVSNITLGYNLPQTVLERINFSRARVYVQADNPILIVKDRVMWLDPEYDSGTYRDDLPSTTFILGVNLAF
ncbi:MAG: SusC/RagA family TonB-linked outer membrane protein [Bacteroidota bacterium]